MSEYQNLRVHLLESLTRYVEKRVPPGDFLRAVLENDLVRAVQYADEIAERNLSTWVRYCFNKIPSGVWGSTEAVRRHLGGE